MQVAVGAFGVFALEPLLWVFYKAREVSFFRGVRLLPDDYLTILQESNCRDIIKRHIEFLAQSTTGESTKKN